MPQSASVMASMLWFCRLLAQIVVMMVMQVSTVDQDSTSMQNQSTAHLP
jgi:hypothetical protein